MTSTKSSWIPPLKIDQIVTVEGQGEYKVSERREDGRYYLTPIDEERPLLTTRKILKPSGIPTRVGILRVILAMVPMGNKGVCVLEWPR